MLETGFKFTRLLLAALICVIENSKKGSKKSHRPLRPPMPPRPGKWRRVKESIFTEDACRDHIIADEEE